MTEYSNKPVEPGYYQSEQQFGAVGGARLQGRKSGREAPRDHVRQPAWEETLQKHDMLPKNANQVGSNRDYNPGQGQLFDTQSITPRDSRSDVEIAKSQGAVTGEITAATSKKQQPGLGAVPGYMPGLTKKQKVNAINNVAEARAATGADRGTGAPFAEIMEDRQAAFNKGSESKAAWYMGTDSSGHFDRTQQGDAARQIQESAARSGGTSSGHIRSVAMTSPQMGWKAEGTTQDPQAPQIDRMGSTAGMFPNLAVAEDVTKAAKSAQASGADVSQAVTDRTFVDPMDREIEMASNRSMVEHPSALGGTPDARQKAAAHVAAEKPGAPTKPYPVSDIKSQKAPNFEASLNLSHIDPAVQRVAAQSYTVDRHDASGVGIDAESKQFKRRGTYEAVAMTGRRAALKNRELPPNEQAVEWESRREDKGLGKGNQMFVAGTGTDGSAPVVRPDLKPIAKPPASRSSRRGKRDIAADMGLDF